MDNTNTNPSTIITTSDEEGGIKYIQIPRSNSDTQTDTGLENRVIVVLQDEYKKNENT